MMKKVLLISRTIEPPWDEASRNLVRSIALNLEGYDFYIMTGTKGSSLRKENIFEKRIYTKRSLSFSQKIRLAGAIFAMQDAYDIYHFCFVPERLASFYIKNIVTINKLKVQTIPYIPSWAFTSPSDTIFGDVITVFSQATKDRLQYYGIENVYVIYPCVDLEIFAPQEKQRDMIKVFYAGYLPNTKVLHDLFTITEVVLKKRCDVEFTFAIRTRNWKEILLKKKLASLLLTKSNGRVSFAGNTYDFLQVMRACDIFIYPCLAGFQQKIDIPFVIAEAMACAKPLLVSNIGPLSEPFAHGGGFLTNAKTAVDFAEKILKLCSDKILLKTIGLENRRVASLLFDARKNFLKIKEIYDQQWK